jgi:cobaltochelatase CobS
MVANEVGQTCTICSQPIQLGEEISWNRRGNTGRYHTACKVNAPAGNDVLGAVLAKTIEPYLTITRDEITEELDARLTEKINEAIANLPKEIKTVYIQNGQTIGQVDGHKHEHFDLLFTLATLRKNVYLWGEAGSGKSSAAKQIAEIMGLDWYYLGLQAQMTESRLMGYMDATGNYVESDFYKAYVYGGIFLLDELELASGNMLGSLNGALANGHASFPNGRQKRHPNCIVIATGNTPALGATIQFSDRRALDGAVRDRFHFIQWDTDETLERQLAAQRFDRSDTWVTWVRAIRALVKRDHPKVTATLRASIEGAELLAMGMSARKVADMLVFRGYEETSVRAFLASYPLPTF